jgi:hypothetical protein
MSAGGTVENLPPAALREAVAALWRIRPPEPHNLFQTPQFVRLSCVVEITGWPAASRGAPSGLS